MEQDDEVKGNGNQYDIGSRTYDTRLGRWLSMDPKTEEFPSHSPYSGNGNNPVLFIDPNGEQIYLPETSIYNEAAIINLSMVTGYVLRISDEVTEFEHPELGLVKGREIIPSEELMDYRDRVVPGFGKALQTLFYKDDVKVLADFGDLRAIDQSNRVNSYFIRDKQGLVFDGSMFTDGDVEDLFIAHLWLHELTETRNLAQKGWKDNNQHNYDNRDHELAWQVDLLAIMTGIDKFTFVLDDGKEVTDYEIQKDRAIYRDPGTSAGPRVILIDYQIGESGKTIGVDIYFYRPGEYDPNATEEERSSKGIKFPENDK